MTAIHDRPLARRRHDMPMVLEWSPTADADAIVRQVRDALVAGQAILFRTPSQSLGLFNPAAASAKEQRESLGSASRPSFLAAGPEDVASLGVAVPRPAARLMLRGWPGPVSIVLPAGENPPPAIRPLLHNGDVAFRWPEHPFLDLLAPALGFPAAIVDAETHGGASIVVQADGEIARPAVVRVSANGWELLDEGSLSKAVIEYLAARMILFVCTGNTCRSPMAEALAKRMLADRLGCSVDELPGRGFWILSAGVAVFGGDPATPAAVEAADEFGADLTRHESRPVNAQILADADDVIAMTRSHAAALAMRYAGLGPGVQLLCGDEDLLDPIGGDDAVYRDCARTIRTHLERWITEWTAS